MAKTITTAKKTAKKPSVKKVVKPVEEKKNWQVILPTPLILDATISDEDIITEMAGAENETEGSSILSSAFEVSKKTYVVNCTKEELFELLTIDADIKLNIELQEYDDMYIILVSDTENNVIGRGEISEVGSKVTKDVFRQAFLKSFSGFQERFAEGQKRMNNLAYKLKALRNGMANVVVKLPDRTSN